METKTILLIGVGVAIVVALIIFLVVYLSSRKSSTKEEETPENKEEVKEETENVAEELKDLKSRIREIETYKYKEYYRSETNNGLTVGGTILEQMIDIAVAVLQQPLIAEMTSKLISKPEDAVTIAEYIERFGKVIVGSLKDNQLIMCKVPIIQECGEETCRDLPDPNYVETGSNCKAYDRNNESIQNVMKSVMTDYQTLLTDETEKVKIYNVVKNLYGDNLKFYAALNGTSDEELERRIGGFPSEEEFFGYVSQMKF